MEITISSPFHTNILKTIENKIKTTPIIARIKATISDNIKIPPAIFYAGGLYYVLLTFNYLISNAITAFDQSSVVRNLPFAKSLA